MDQFKGQAKSFGNGVVSGMSQGSQPHYGQGQFQASTAHHGAHHGSYSQTELVSHSQGGFSSAQNVRKVSEVVTSDQLVLPKNAYEQSSRKISSVVVFEEQEKIPEKNIRYVEVPQYEEVIKTVAIKETKVVEKIVNKVVEEWVERIVEIPQIEEVIRHVEVPQIVETIKHVPKIEVVDRPFEVIKEVKVTQINKVERVQEIGHETIEVPKAHLQQQTVNMTSYNDSEAMLVVGQKIRPVIVDGASVSNALMGSGMGHGHAHGSLTVDLCEFSPEVMPVDIHVAKFVDQDLVMTGVTESWHKVVTVSAAQYNSMLKFLNQHLNQTEIDGLPFLSGATGQVDFLPQNFNWQSPNEGLKIYGYHAGQIWGQGSVVHTHKKSSGMSQQQMVIEQQKLDQEFHQIFSQYEQAKNMKMQNIEQFNQQQIQKVQREMASNHHVSHHHVSSHSNQHHAIGYNQSMFDKFDVNGDGMVSKQEFAQGAHAIMSGHY